MDRILDLIDEALARKGLSDAAASKLAVGNYSLIKNMRAARSADKRYNFQALERLAQVLDLECYFGAPRDMNNETHVVLEGKDYAQIPVHAATLSAGGGALNGDDLVSDHVAFKREWLRRIDVAPSKAVIAKVVGDSMEPTVWEGDSVLIDTAQRVVPLRKENPLRSRSSIYAILDDGEARVKRLERPAEDTVLLLSDNTDYRPELIDARKLSIIGKVVWWGHTNRE